MQHGYIKVAAAVPSVKVADCLYNVRQTEALIAQAEGRGVEIIVFPELGLTGYTCQDLFRQNLLLEQAEAAVLMLLDFTRNLDVISIVGVPVSVNNRLLNCAVVIQKGDILGIVPKTWLPNYSEFYEKRWFVSSLDINDTDIRFAGNKVRVYADSVLFRTCDGVCFGVLAHHGREALFLCHFNGSPFRLSFCQSATSPNKAQVVAEVMVKS